MSGLSIFGSPDQIPEEPLSGYSNLVSCSVKLFTVMQKGGGGGCIWVPVVRFRIFPH